jgi:hypothetical protein
MLQDEFQYYILSLKHSPGYAGKSLWWGPDDRGYVEDMNYAGKYTKEQIEENPEYYNDGVSTLAVREDLVAGEMEKPKIFVPWHGEKWWRERASEIK